LQWSEVFDHLHDTPDLPNNIINRQIITVEEERKARQLKLAGLHIFRRRPTFP
jgi:hypothetical protein